MLDGRAIGTVRVSFVAAADMSVCVCVSDRSSEHDSSRLIISGE